MKFSDLRLDRAVVSAFILVVGSYFAFTHDVKTVNAASNASGLTGQYGCMLNRNGSGYAVLWEGHDGIGTNVLLSLDFSSNTGKGMTTFTDDYGTLNVKTGTTTVSTTFTELAAPEVPNVYKWTHTITNADNSSGGTGTFIGILTNSGNTILMSQTEANNSKATWSGVCQKT